MVSSPSVSRKYRAAIRVSNPSSVQQPIALSRLLVVFTVMAVAAIHPVLAINPPEVSAIWSGPAEKVFDSDTEACDRLDIPDQPARAFRDANGEVHLFATHFLARAMVGPGLDAVRRNCRVVYRSPRDADPSHFQDRNWLGSFYTADGQRIVALVHSEYEAWTHPGMCATPKAQWPTLANCWWNSITMAMSQDGGTSFTSARPPANLVASLPYPYDKGNTVGAIGYNTPTNIIKVGTYYYAMIGDWPYKAQRYGPCLIRTMDPFDATSWRAWDGSDFRIRFINPYADHDFTPEKHVCAPIGVDAVYDPGSLSVYGPGGSYLIAQFAEDARFGTPGLYLSTSSDLIHWSKPSRVATTKEMLDEESPGKWRYGYVALLDPNAPDRNFSTVLDMPFVYYVRFDLVGGNLSRILMRRRVLLHFGT